MAWRVLHLLQQYLNKHPLKCLAHSHHPEILLCILHILFLYFSIQNTRTPEFGLVIIAPSYKTNLLATYFILVILLSISATGAEYKNSLYLLWPLCKSVLFSPLFRLKHIHTQPCQGLCKKKITRVDPLVLISREGTAAHPAARLLQLPSCSFSSPKLSSFTFFFLLPLK